MFARYFYMGMLLVAVVSLGACGKSLDQTIRVGQGVIGIVGQMYQDAQENLSEIKKLVAPASPANPVPPPATVPPTK